jgi:hypothetical protein
MVNIIKVLVAAGADVNAVDSAGKKPIDYADSSEITVLLMKLTEKSGLTQKRNKIF